jgi:hypothetical protein
MWHSTFPVMLFSTRNSQVAITRRCYISAAIGAFAFSVGALQAQLIPIGPFSTPAVETFESFTPGFYNPPLSLSIMNGMASLQSAAAGPGIIRPGSFNFGLGDSSQNAPFQCVVPSDGQNLMGLDGGTELASADVFFTNTVKAFGGYWGAEAETTPATITFTFYDALDQPINAPQAVSYVRLSGDGMLEWHGWFSTTPIKHVKIASSDLGLVGDGFRAGTGNFSFVTSVSALNTTQFVVKGMGGTGLVYSVQANTNLATTNWITVGTAPTDANGALQFTNTSAFPQRFYRLQSP